MSFESDSSGSNVFALETWGKAGASVSQQILPPAIERRAASGNETRFDGQNLIEIKSILPHGVIPSVHVKGLWASGI